MYSCKKPTDLVNASVLPVVPEPDTVVKEPPTHELVYQPHLGDGVEEVEEFEGVEVEDIDVVPAPDLGVVVKELVDSLGPALRVLMLHLPLAGEDFHPASLQQLPGKTRQREDNSLAEDSQEDKTGGACLEDEDHANPLVVVVVQLVVLLCLKQSQLEPTSHLTT